MSIVLKLADDMINELVFKEMYKAYLCSHYKFFNIMNRYFR
jgi:hypothetical protein